MADADGWDYTSGYDAASNVQELSINAGHSFGGKGRGFQPVNISDDSSSWNSNTQGGDRRGHGGGRGGRGGGRGGRYDNDRDGGGFNRRNYNGDGNSYASVRDDTDGDYRGGDSRGRRNNGDGDWNNRGERRRYNDWDSGKGEGDNRESRGRFNNRDGDDNRSSGWKNNNNNSSGDKGGEDGQEKRPPIYVPKEKTDEELWADSGIMKGINFKDYQNIKVNATGNNVPDKIHTFSDARFRDLLINNLKKCHYDEPTPIQQWAIPIIMEKRDLMATAQTGSGKTAAYLLPAIHMILNENNENTGGVCAPRILVLSPTRELAIQIREVAEKFARGSYLNVRILYGGTSMGYQRAQLQRGCDILVATPGRLIDFVNRNNLNFSSIKFLILDEADRMLDMGMCDDIRTIFSHETMPSKGQRQTLMFSATFSDSIQRLAQNYLNDYIFLAIGIVGGACKDVKQIFVEVSSNDKKKQLMEILNESNDVNGTLLFVNQKRTADFIASYLSSSDFPTTSIHGDRFQPQREEALNDFKTRKMKILVATAVASRGLDINGVKHVINYDLPESVDEYVHRIGRTGRLGNRGLATSFYDPSTDAKVASELIQILKQADQEVPLFLESTVTSGAGLTSTENFGGSDYRQRSSDDANFKTGSRNQPVPFHEEEEMW